MRSSSTICCDANLIIDWAIEDGNVNASAALVERWLSSGVELIAPSLIHFEITNVLFRHVRTGRMPHDRIRFGLDSALALPIAVVDDDDLHLQAFDIGRRFNLSAAYDAHYLALAEREGVEFWTTDRRLYNTVRHRLSWVRHVDSEAPSNL